VTGSRDAGRGKRTAARLGRVAAAWLVLGLIELELLLVAPLLLLVVSIPAVVLGRMAKERIADGRLVRGADLARAGVILGWAGIAFGGVFLFWWAIGIGGLGGGGGGWADL
jgi:hypothetical protein